MNNAPECIHWNDAAALLESGRPCDIRCWKLSTGDILTYTGVTCCHVHRRGGTHLVQFPQSGELRLIRDITIFEINGTEIIR